MSRSLLYETIRLLIMCCIFWALVTVTIQVFKCPEMSARELIYYAPDNFKAHWTDCGDWRPMRED